LAQDPYQELGVARSASADEVRRAFRKLAKQYHPDKNQGDKAAEERFKRVSSAFDLLGDEEKRKKFDRGEIDAEGRETARGFDPFNRGGFGPSKGADVRARLEIDLEDAIRGARKRIAFADGRTIDVTIPKGAADGQTLRLKGRAMR
jgi:DnaJ-class molecular chaperone